MGGNGFVEAAPSRRIADARMCARPGRIWNLGRLIGPVAMFGAPKNELGVYPHVGGDAIKGHGVPTDKSSGITPQSRDAYEAGAQGIEFPIPACLQF